MIITVCRYIGILDTALMRPILGDHKAFGNVSDNGHQLVHARPDPRKGFHRQSLRLGHRLELQ